MPHLTMRFHRWDAACTETVEWQEDAGVQQLSAKADQPFYQVLVDWSDAFSDRSIFSGQSLIAYVAQDMLSVPEVSLSYSHFCLFVQR